MNMTNGINYTVKSLPLLQQLIQYVIEWISHHINGKFSPGFTVVQRVEFSLHSKLLVLVASEFWLKLLPRRLLAY